MGHWDLSRFLHKKPAQVQHTDRTIHQRIFKPSALVKGIITY
jgi:hypothetical protein